jgi:tRNA 5-methylaminomethyl-2-thiouridine biosynthesis bifunctional protein
LHILTNEAFTFAKDFYLKHTPKHFHQTGVLRIPKDAEDASKFPLYESYNTHTYLKYSKEDLAKLGILAPFESFYFPDAGDCDGVEVCHTLLEKSEICYESVENIERKDEIWHVNSYTCKHLILATGYESILANIDYMGIGGTWGTRGDFSSKKSLTVSMHQSMSVGANRAGILKLGATHERLIKTPKPCDKEEALSLKDKAKDLIDVSDLVLEKTFCGMRANSKDSFPLVGQVIAVENMLKKYPQLKKGAKVPLEYIPSLYVLNGLGGRGFVFAPLMAKILSEHLVEGKALDTRFSPDRLFYKWCRKLKD